MSKTLGRPSWVIGAKLRFFAVASDEWQDAKKKGQLAAGVFYTNFTKKFIACFGWHFDFKKDDKEWVELSHEQWENIKDTTGLSEEETAKRQEYYRELRKSVVAWWSAYHNKPSKEQAKKTDMEIKTTLAKIAGTLPKPPRRTRMTQFYSRTYYPLRCKAAFDVAWEHEQTRELAPGEKRMKQLDLANKLAIDAYQREPQEFKDWLFKQREKEHENNVKEYEENMKALDVVPEDAPSYHKALANAALFMQPLCDLTAKKFGGAVTMLVVLPVENGAIEMRSVFSGKTAGLDPKNYAEFDPDGFDALQESFVNFGQHVFTKADRETRILRTSEEPEEDESEEHSEESAVHNPFAPTPAALPSNPTTPAIPPPPQMITPATTPPPQASGLTPPSGPTSPAPAPSLTSPPTPIIPPAQPALSSAPSPRMPLPAPSRPSSSTPTLAERTPSMPTPSTPSVAQAPSIPLPPTPSGAQMSGPPAVTSTPAPNIAAILSDADIENIPAPAAAALSGVLAVADQWGPEWAQAVATFVQCEREAQFTAKEFRLPSSTHRPECIKTWFGQKRPMSGPQWEGHGTGDGAAFGVSWWAWWADIQPDGRQVQGDIVPDTDGSMLDWTRLCKPGPSGILLVMVALVWWKKMLDGAMSDSWTRAVLDVEAAIRHSRLPAPKSNGAPQKKRNNAWRFPDERQAYKEEEWAVVGPTAAKVFAKISELRSESQHALALADAAKAEHNKTRLAQLTKGESGDSSREWDVSGTWIVDCPYVQEGWGRHGTDECQLIITFEPASQGLRMWASF
ncbi:hypothetical protein HWV62_32828 [Athelia sp. TMB]|nr:hypothetical protein HWV62_32828 [Athelia sp. TMB]